MNILEALTYWIVQISDSFSAKISYERIVAFITVGKPGSLIKWKGTKQQAKLLLKYVNKNKPALPDKIINHIRKLLEKITDLGDPFDKPTKKYQMTIHL